MGIKEALTNLTQETSEDRVAVDYLTDTNKHLANQAIEQANNMVTNDTTIKNMQKLIQKLKEDIRTLTTRQAGQSNKKTGYLGNKKGNWGTSPQ